MPSACCNVGNLCTSVEKLSILPPDIWRNLILFPKSAQNLGFSASKSLEQCQEESHRAILHLFDALFFNRSRVFIENAIFTSVFGKQNVHLPPGQQGAEFSISIF